MSDDIVTRLREYNPVRGFIDWHDTMTTAADEIERLRELVRLLKYSLEHQVCECSHCLGEEGAT